jgi:hypothetical protein
MLLITPMAIDRFEISKIIAYTSNREAEKLPKLKSRLPV